MNPFYFPIQQPPKVLFQDELNDFEVDWNRQSIPIEKAVQRLQNGEFPDDLFIFHPTYGTVNMGIAYDNTYSVGRSGPSFMRGAIARSFGNSIVDKEHLLDFIDDVFGNVVTKLEQLSLGRQKLLRLQLEAARKVMRSSGQNIPRNVENIILQQIGEKKPVTSAYNVPNSQARIQTNLFTNEVVMPRHLKKINTTLFNGGKRKTKRQRRRTTRRR